MELDGRKVAILAEDHYEDPELWYPFYRLKEAGAQVTVVGTGRAQTFSSKHGYPVKADLDAPQAKVEDFDAVVIPGGYSPDKIRTDEGMVSLTRSIHEAGKPVAAICHGPWTLVEADVLKGRTLTSWPSLKTDIRNAGGNWVDEEVHVDEGLVTSRRPDDLKAFCEAFLDVFAQESQEAV